MKNLSWVSKFWLWQEANSLHPWQEVSFLYLLMWKNIKVLVAQSCLTLCNPMNCSPPGASVHGILQARILEWVAIPFSRWSSRSRDQTWPFCIGRRVLYHLSYQGSPPLKQRLKVKVSWEAQLICDMSRLLCPRLLEWSPSKMVPAPFLRTSYKSASFYLGEEL